jgi:hypothetical protein
MRWGVVSRGRRQLEPTVDVSYADGRVCFEGGIDSEGWGGVYGRKFADVARRVRLRARCVYCVCELRMSEDEA